jgi:hypothetical protein
MFPPKRVGLSRIKIIFRKQCTNEGPLEQVVFEVALAVVV